MTSDQLLPLAKTTLRDPHAAAKTLLQMDVGRDALWTAVALVAAVNSLLIIALMQVSPAPFPLPGYFENPLALFMLQAGMLVVFLHVLFWVGKAFGGEAELGDVLLLGAWILVLNVVFRLVLVVTTVLIPPVAVILSLVGLGWTIWVVVSFVQTGFRLRTWLHGLVVLVVGAIGMIFGVALILSIITVFAQGVVGSV